MRLKNAAQSFTSWTLGPLRRSLTFLKTRQAVWLKWLMINEKETAAFSCYTFPASGLKHSKFIPFLLCNMRISYFFFLIYILFCSRRHLEAKVEDLMAFMLWEFIHERISKELQLHLSDEFRPGYRRDQHSWKIYFPWNTLIVCALFTPTLQSLSVLCVCVVFLHICSDIFEPQHHKHNSSLGN